jgi:hypothetical protein
MMIVSLKYPAHAAPPPGFSPGCEFQRTLHHRYFSFKNYFCNDLQSDQQHYTRLKMHEGPNAGL